MSNFERRGLPFRDVFDSSFDNIVYVDYFAPDESKALLAQRVIGKPVPFFYLSYCLSGGLPRDMIRAFRQIVEIHQQDRANNTLSLINSSIISSEIKAKMRAMGFIVKKLDDLPETNEFITLLFALQTELITSGLLMQKLGKLEEWYTSIITKKEACCVKDSTTKELLPYCNSLLNLFDELSSYLLLMLTLLDFFNDSLTKHNIEVAEAKNDFFKLAQARQAMAIDPHITKVIIREFRVAHEMVSLSPTRLSLSDSETSNHQ